MSRELNARIPQFHPYGLDYDMISFVYRDLINWFRVKWNIEDSYSIPSMLEGYIEEDSEELNVFLSLWLDSWLEKWRERVRILHKKPQVPESRLEQANKCMRIFRKMDHSTELKDALIRRLINHGEICMTEQIAENLIVEEIGRFGPRADEGKEIANLNPVEILNSLMPRTYRLAKEKGPLVYLRLKTGAF